MHLSYKTLAELIVKPKRISARELGELLTMSVMEVESVTSEAEKLNKVTVGLVIKVSTHLNADKLKLATVDIGGKTVEIVCGGINLKEGMKVALAQPGALVKWHGEGEFASLEAATIRGVKSNGMACSAAELGLVDDNEPEHGIMDLSYLDAKPGTLLAKALGKDDLVIEVDNKSITHRPDLWSHLGVARELAALWNTKLKLPELADLPKGSNGFKVEIKNSDLCHRYMGVVLAGIKITSSPTWLKNRLEALGMRSINNVVDAANYVMLETGQPLHTFDLQKLSSPKIVVRTANSGEVIKTLDGESRKLSSEMLVIADDKSAIAVAGVMGGEFSEVSSSTTNLVVESATFNPISIRQTASKLGLRSEASVRFEKALDPELAEIGIKRFVAIMQQIITGVKVASDLVDEYPKKFKPVEINVNPDWINERLGTKIKYSQIKNILENLGFKIKVIASGSKQSHKIATPIRADRDDSVVKWQVTVPSWRATRDVTIREDLLEEVARIYGYGKITPSLPSFTITKPLADEKQLLMQKIRECLIGAGFTETLSHSFVGEKDLQNFGLTIRGKHITSDLSIELENPTDQGKPYLRPTLLPNFLGQAGLNSQKHKNVKMFEIGRVFVAESGKEYLRRPGGGNLPKQPFHLGIVLGRNKRDERDDLLRCYRDMVGVLVQIGHELENDFKLVEVQKIKHDWFNENMAADIIINNETVGHIGILQEKLRRELDLPEFTAVIELSLDMLEIGPTSPSEPPPEYPEAARDLSIILPERVTWSQIQKEIENMDLLESIELFDVYAPKHSIAFTVTLRASDRTLTSEEVDKVIEKIKQILIKKFNAEVRDH
ncbi:MAG: phenylalanine--tRNA ligase subunit beta [Patescibacteria group bacterium]